MEIQISNETAAMHLASAAGCSVEEYVNTLINQSVEAKMTPEELQASVRSIERGIEDMKAGRGQPAKEAMDEIAAKFGFELPEDQFQRLSAVAHAAGYQDVLAFITSFADDPIEDPRGNLTETQLRDNVAAMERGEAEIDAGGGQEMKQALVEIADKYDLNITQ